MAVGKVSFEDWPMLTWSLGCNRLLGPRGAPDQLDAPVGDHLVDVRVGLDARFDKLRVRSRVTLTGAAEARHHRSRS